MCSSYSPVDDKVVGLGAPALHVVRVLVGDILRSETDGGVF